MMSQSFSALDWVIAALFIVALILGFVRGFIRQLLSIAGLLLAYFAAYHFYGQLAPLLKAWIPLSALNSYDQYAFMVGGLQLDKVFYNAAAFALIFFAVKIVLTILSHLFDVLAKIPGISFLNKWGGALLAVAEVFVIVAVAISVMSAMPSVPMQGLLKDSVLVNWFMQYTPMVTDTLRELWNSGKAV